MNEPGIRAETTRQIIDRLKTADRLCQPATSFRLAGLGCKLPLVGSFKIESFSIKPLKIARDLHGRNTRVQIGQIPFRQRALFRYGSSPGRFPGLFLGLRRLCCLRGLGAGRTPLRGRGITASG